MRSLPLWQNTTDGGAATFECQWHSKGSVSRTAHGERVRTRAEWHPHLHVIAEGNRIDQAELAAAWHQITGDSFKVDIRLVKTGADAAHYVAKYVTKGTVNDVWADANAAKEWIEATAGLRCCFTFGTWRGFKLLEKPSDDARWESLGLLTSIVQAARDGDRRSQEILARLRDEVKFDPGRKRGHQNEPAP